MIPKMIPMMMVMVPLERIVSTCRRCAGAPWPQGAEIKYSTVQNWYAGDVEGKGGIYNFVTKRGLCDGNDSKISWTQVTTPRSRGCS